MDAICKAIAMRLQGGGGICQSRSRRIRVTVGHPLDVSSLREAAHLLMRLNTERLSYYETAFTELRERLIRVLGAPTVTRLIERAVVEISAAHPSIASLRCDDNTVMFDSVRAAFAEAQEDEIRDAFAALNGVLLLIVARLLGNQIAERLTEGLTVADILHTGGLGGQ